MELILSLRNWRFFGENGLAGEEVSVWVYDQTLKIEYQATALSLYSITCQPDHQHILDVKNPRRIETNFRSPQIDLWQLSDTEWPLALRRPEQQRSRRRKLVALARQLPLPEFGATG
jgi:putative transposase